MTVITPLQPFCYTGLLCAAGAPVKYLFLIMALGMAPGLSARDADADSDNNALLRDEVRDAEAREQAELDDRLRDLERQQQASKAIAEKQQQLIEALQAQIRALQENDNDRSDRPE